MIDLIQWVLIAALFGFHIVHFRHEAKIWNHIRDLWGKR